MNKSTNKMFYTVLIHDNFASNKTDKQFKQLTEFLQPDLCVTTNPVNDVVTFNSTNYTSEHVISNIYITNDNCTDQLPDKEYIKLTRDITHRFHTNHKTYLLIGTGKEYEHYIKNHKEWYGRYNDLSWIIPYFQCSDLSFCLLYIDKLNYKLQTGIHNFSWMFWSSKCNYQGPNNIFVRDFDFDHNKPKISWLNHK